MSRSAAQSAFEALSDPTRRRILRMLSDQEEISAGEVADGISDIGRTAVSNHLRILRTADLIVERKEGRFRFYSMHPDGPVQDVLSYLQTLLSQGVTGPVDDAAARVDTSSTSGRDGASRRASAS